MGNSLWIKKEYIGLFKIVEILIKTINKKQVYIL